MSHTVPPQDIHVLIIDDCPETLRPLSGLIRSAGMRPSLLTEPRQALQRAQALRPDLILLDVHMAQMDGFAVCRLLQEAPQTRQIPIIFLTSAVAVEQRLQGLTLGAVDYVVKPFLRRRCWRASVSMYNWRGGTARSRSMSTTRRRCETLIRSSCVPPCD